MFAKLLLYAAGGVVLVVAAAFSAFTAYLTYIYWKYSHLPSPKRSSFFLGHFSDLIKLQKEFGYKGVPITELFLRWSMDVQKPVFVIFLVGMPWVILTSPEFVKEVAMKPLHDKPKSFWKDFQILFGERFALKSVLTTLDYETWLPKRKLYDPCFKKTYLEGLIPAFNESVDKFLQKLKPLADGKTGVPIIDHFREFTLDVISKAAFGSDTADLYPQHESPAGYTSKQLYFFVGDSLKGFSKCLTEPSVTLYKLLHQTEVRGYRESVRAMRKIGRHCIEKRIAAIQSGEKVPNDILTQILRTAATKLTDDLEELVDDFVAFYHAGQETTASTLSFVTALLHLNPHVLERLVAEVDEVLGDKDTVSAADLAKLEYTEQVLLESLRMYPRAVAVLKCPRTGIHLGEYYIPAGSTILLPTGAMCRMPEFFDEPEVFDPSRFDPQNERPNPFVFFPFGVGHRACIGKPFAIMEAKISLARLLQQFKLTIPPDYKIVEVQRTVTQLKDDLICTLTQRM